MNTLNSKDISNDLYKLLISLNTGLFNPSELTKGLPIPPSHVKVLFHLCHKGPSSVSDIAKRLIISKPNMTPIIDKLLSDGFVHRYNSPTDRRILMIEITDKARSFLKEQAEIMKNLLADRISSLSDEDLETLNESIKNMQNIMIKLK